MSQEVINPALSKALWAEAASGSDQVEILTLAGKTEKHLRLSGLRPGGDFTEADFHPRSRDQGWQVTLRIDPALAGQTERVKALFANGSENTSSVPGITSITVSTERTDPSSLINPADGILARVRFPVVKRLPFPRPV